MYKRLHIMAVCVMVLVCMAGCARAKQVTNQMLADFGLRPQPVIEKPDIEGEIRAKLASIGKTELDRLNGNPANVEVKFETMPGSSIGLGQFYKTVKVYENAYPLDVTRKRAPQVQQSETLRKLGYTARIEYRYRIYRGKPSPSRDDARDSVADIKTDEAGREILIYHFDETGAWDAEHGRFDRRIESKEEPTTGAQTEGQEQTSGLKRIEVGGSLRLSVDSVHVDD